LVTTVKSEPIEVVTDMLYCHHAGVQLYKQALVHIQGMGPDWQCKIDLCFDENTDVTIFTLPFTFTYKIPIFQSHDWTSCWFPFWWNNGLPLFFIFLLTNNAMHRSTIWLNNGSPLFSLYIWLDTGVCGLENKKKKKKKKEKGKGGGRRKRGIFLIPLLVNWQICPARCCSKPQQTLWQPFCRISCLDITTHVDFVYKGTNQLVWFVKWTLFAPEYLLRLTDVKAIKIISSIWSCTMILIIYILS